MTIKPNIIASYGDKIKERTILPIPQKLRPIAPVETRTAPIINLHKAWE